ncbi:MAG: hypothetical protein AAGD14_08025, partial [Planctomycetota bacterium]
KHTADWRPPGAGRWYARLLGRDQAQKVVDSADALRDEYRRGRVEAEETPPETRAIEHRVVEEEDDK